MALNFERAMILNEATDPRLVSLWKFVKTISKASNLSQLLYFSLEQRPLKVGNHSKFLYSPCYTAIFVPLSTTERPVIYFYNQAHAASHIYLEPASARDGDIDDMFRVQAGGVQRDSHLASCVVS